MSALRKGAAAGLPERETPIVVAILVALHYEQGVVVFRNNTGGAKYAGAPGSDGPRRVRFGLGTGSADLVGIVGPLGRFFALEVKTPNGSTHKARREAQARWLARVREMGGFAAIVHSVPEAQAALRRARLGALE